MLFADGKSTVSGAGELRHKETDRLKAMAEVLKQAGARFTVHDDGLEVYGDPEFKPAGTLYNSYHDHRIAMASAVLSLMGTGPGTISGAECAAISYPSFWDDVTVLTN
jgi:3-phosphoshikimate 1-carboxyvinyltransferase